MPSSSFVLGSGATFVSLLSLAAASPLTYVSSTTQENAWDPWASSSTTTSSKPKDPATSTWSEWDPKVTSSTTRSSSSKSSDPAWGNWNGVSSSSASVTSRVGCGVGISTYTTKPCWTVDNKQTCTEVVKTTQFDLCSTTSKPITQTSTVSGDWNNWGACATSVSTWVETSCKQGGPCYGVTKTSTVSSCSATPTSTKSSTTDYNWNDWCGTSTSTSVYTTKPCWTVDNKQTCTEVVKTKTDTVTDCKSTTSSSKPNTATSTTSAYNGGWNNWNGNGNNNAKTTTATCGGVTTTTLSSCVTPAPTSVTSCTTYHLETAPYAATSSCSTYAAKESVGPVCATYVAALTYKCETTSTCSTPEAAKSTTCSLKNTLTSSSKSADPSSTWADWSATTSKSADPSTSTWADWSSASTSTKSASAEYTTSCTTYHLEKAPYTATSSCSTYVKSTSAAPNMVNPFVTECATITAKVTPVCSAVTKTSTITSTITAYTTSNGNGVKSTTSTVSCSTPAVSVVTNCQTINTYTAPAASSTCYGKGACSTYHLEVAPYTATSSCFTTTTCEAVSKPTGVVGMPNPFTTKCDTTTVTPAAVCSTVWGQWDDSNKVTTTSKTPDAATGTGSVWSSWTAQPTSVQGVKTYTGAASSVEAGALVMVAAAVIGGAAMIL